ncbi:MAG: C10 family peptidase, partial [Prevotella sp.]|nr:C10 family peptidase [Prevotella sp.]
MKKYFVLCLASAFCLYSLTSFSQAKHNSVVKSFLATAPDTVEQGVPFVVDYSLEAMVWDAGGKPLEGNGCRLQNVSYNKVSGTPYSKLKAKCIYITSKTGSIELPGMVMSVRKKKVTTTPKTIYVKPNRNYGEEMGVAHKWLTGHGLNDDSLCLTIYESPLAKEFYIFRDERHQGFCVVAKKDGWNVVGQPILAYSTENSLLLTNWKGYMNLLNPYNEQIAALKKRPNSHTTGDDMHYGRKNDRVAPMLGNLQWGQSSPYNHHVVFSVNGKRGVIGCVPLAVAMVMNYYKWPNQAQSHVYYQTEHKIYKMDMDSFKPEWDAFRNSYSEKDTTQCDNLALLLSRLGVAVDANYMGKETSANLVNAKSTMCNNFKYSGKMNMNVTPLPDQDMMTLIYKELDNGRPLIASTNGHAFVCDGYDDDFLHYNLGWHGAANGYYRLKLGDYEAENSLLIIKNVLYGIEPQREDVNKDVVLNVAGTLEQLLSDDEKGSVTHLTVSGPLNSKDIRLLRKMAGA